MVNKFVDCGKHYEMFIESPSFGTFKVLIDCEDYALVKDFHWIVRKQNKKMLLYKCRSPH